MAPLENLNTKFVAENPPFWGESRDKIENLSTHISYAGNLQLSVRKIGPSCPLSLVS